MLVADCIALSCCTQCLILQIIILLLLKLPCKLIRKTKEYAKKKLGRGKKEEKMIKMERLKVKGEIQDEAVKLHTSTSMSIELIQGLGMGGGEDHGFQCCCIEEAEKMLEEHTQKGEFGFGSFWGRPETEAETCSAASEECDFVQYELIEIACFS